MSKIIGNVAKATALLVGVPVVALFAYDTMAVRPHLARIQTVLAQANPEDRSPPQIIRELIDANAGSPTPHATRLVTSRVYSGLTQGQWQVRNVLWQVLLPMHLDKSQMYGLYSVLSYNGTDRGLSNFARREFGKPLSQLSPMQAATTIAITRAPSIYLGDRVKLAERARVLLNASRHAP
ncbi:transglycosylase domain-containing protein [Xanthomonas sp. 4461]|uniref:transglycosylase domain-containing protein n=1 Tax=Xanthomonas sp. 4461 TaxID=3035313 RepID=UPI002168C492|nr:transglycosylase domain-containing protein [Xanthomonas sp. 4461]MCS3811220.1 hypothetical protein [Xanthomonas sp. 4461]